ncbi:TrbI F-type domain-containing protein [Novosphingobium gossypii]|uniref:TrbI F-type domain-containing protein n=1 Tax=Novosphingobium gossypii TaxID=1604774 RepID=UPI003D24E8FF
MPDILSGEPMFPGIETAPAAAKAKRPAAPVKRGVSVKEVLTVAALVGAASWGAWVTKSIVDPARDEGRFVKLQLQGVITEYLQAQARSGSDERSAAAATTAFMGELDKAVASLGKSGKVVLVNEAVIGGDLPDVTEEVKKAVYAKVPMPKMAAAPVQQDMQAYLAANGSPAGPNAAQPVIGGAGGVAQ